MNVKELMGRGDKIMLSVLPFLVFGLVLNILYPDLFSIGSPRAAFQLLSILVLIVGVTLWIWTVVLILTRVPRHQLITSGPYAIMKHPLYTGVALLVFPWVGFLFGTWLGLAIGLILYGASRIFSPQEEQQLAAAFGMEWEKYTNRVILPWL